MRHGVRAQDADNERVRISLRLRHALRPIAQGLGEDTFSAAVLRAVREGPLAAHAVVHEVLGAIRPAEPRDAALVAERVEQVHAALVRLAHTLTTDLRYERPEAEDILAGAVAMYLDERFSVSSRRALFGH